MDGVVEEMDYQLWLGDCLEEMDRIEDGSVDAIICDLPYQVTACKWDKMIPLEPLWKHYKRVIKRNGVIALFGSGVFSFLLWASNRDWYKYKWIWDKVKPNGMGYAKFQPMRRTEDILIFCSGSPLYNPQLVKRDKPRAYRNYSHSSINAVSLGAMNSDKVTEFYYPNDVLQYSNADQTNRLHPTQKPVALLSYLIKTYTNEGDLILDNCAGSGSTLEAAMRCNRRSIGIEKDEGYYRIAKDRLERVAAELRGELTHLPMFEGLPT